jgi:hypothetical protein
MSDILPRRRLLVLLSGLILAPTVLEALIVGIPRAQRVEIVLTHAGTVDIHRELKLINRLDSDGCRGLGLQGATDGEGRYVGTRFVWWRLLDVFMGHLSKDTLCVMDSAGWRVAWQLPYGPTRDQVRLTCDLALAPTGGADGPFAPGAFRRVCRIGD